MQAAVVRTRSTRVRPHGALEWITLVTAFLIALPLLSVISTALQPGGEAWVHIANTSLSRYVANTVVLMLGVAALVISMGTVSGWLVTMYGFPGRRLLEYALVVPLAMPAYVLAYAYTDWLQFTGPVQGLLRELTGWEARQYWFPEIRTIGGAAMVLSFALYPYVYLLARTAFLDLSRNALEAGRLAGYSAVRVFFHVALPLARPAVVAGAALALMETLADFGTVSYFGLEVFTTGIFKAWMSMGDRVAAGQLSLCLLGFVVIVLTIERYSRGRAAYHSTLRKAAPVQQLQGWCAALACAACGAPVFFGFVLPTGILLHLAFGDDALRWSEKLTQILGNSVSVAGITALIAVTLATVMAYSARLTRLRRVLFANRVASLSYAIPGAVIAVGVLLPLGRFDNAFADFLERSFGMHVGLVLTGSLFALVYAYLVRFLAIAHQSVEAGLAKITPSMEDAARSLGAAPLRTLRRVHAPLLASSLATAALLVFVDVMKELPATFALRPFNFDTLAVYAYHLAKDERLAEAALPSLVIVAAGLLPLILASKRMMRAA